MWSGSVKRHDARSIGVPSSSGRSCTVSVASALSRSAGGYGRGGARSGSRARPARRRDSVAAGGWTRTRTGARDRRAVVAERFGRREPDHARAAHDVPLPPRPRDAVPAPEQEAVARLDAIGQPGHRERADAQRQRRHRSAVRDAVEQPAVARAGSADAARRGRSRRSPIRRASVAARSRSTICRLASVVGSTA